jgi:ribosome-associated protein
MQIEELKQLVIKAIEDLKGENIVELDVSGKTSVTDLMIIVSGTSSRHVKSIADNVVEEAKKAGVRPLGVEGETQAEWVLVDLGDIVVHVMQPHVREFYDLERLWRFDADQRGANAG